MEGNRKNVLKYLYNLGLRLYRDKANALSFAVHLWSLRLQDIFHTWELTNSFVTSFNSSYMNRKPSSLYSDFTELRSALLFFALCTILIILSKYWDEFGTSWPFCLIIQILILLTWLGKSWSFQRYQITRIHFIILKIRIASSSILQFLVCCPSRKYIDHRHLNKHKISQTLEYEMLWQRQESDIDDILQCQWLSNDTCVISSFSFNEKSGVARIMLPFHRT